MDEKTEELRDLFVETTGSDTVTERKEESRGSLAGDRPDPSRRTRDLVGTLRERSSFTTDLSDDALVDLVRGYFDGESDAALAESLSVTAATVADARHDLHLVRDEERAGPADYTAVRNLVADGHDAEAVAAELDCEAEAVAEQVRAARADLASTRASDRFRDELTELFTDAELSAEYARDAREDGLKDATEDIETDVSF